MALSTIGRNQLNTGIDDNSDATAITIDSSENVGIGTAPAVPLHVKASAPGFALQTSGSMTSGNRADFNAYNSDTSTVGLIRFGAVTDNVGTDIQFHSRPAGGSLTEAMRIDSSGNVGIGTSAVAAASTGTNVNIHSPVAQTTYLKLSTTGTGNSASDGVDLICDNSGNGYLYNRENANIIFGTNSAERMRIDSSGNLMIGTTDSTYNSIGAPAALTSFNNGSRFGANFGASTTGGQYAVVFSNPNGQIGGVFVSGSATSYVTSSDYRLKTEVTYDWDATTRLKQLKPARFKWIADGDDAVFVDGFLAHECGAVPESITGEKDAVDDDGKIIPQGIDQSKIVPLLTKALIEAVEKIEALEARITALEEQDT